MQSNSKLRSWFANNKVIAFRRVKPGPEASTLAIVSASLPISTMASTPLYLDFAQADPGQAVTTDLVRRVDLAGHENSSARNIREYVITGLAVVSSAAGAVPIAGGPMKAAIGGVLEVLKIFDKMAQNKEDLKKLRADLNRLSSEISSVPASGDPRVNERRRDLIENLNNTADTLRKLRNSPKLRYTTISRCIVGCSEDIDRFLRTYQTLSNMNIENEMEKVRARQEQGVQEVTHGVQRVYQLFLDQPGQQMPKKLATGFVTLVDAAGRSHNIQIELTTSFKGFNAALKAFFVGDTPQDRLLLEYIQRGSDAYDLCIDDNRQVVQLTSQGWPSIVAGTKIVMRIIKYEEKVVKSEQGYECPGCNAWCAEKAGEPSYTCSRCDMRFGTVRVTLWGQPKNERDEKLSRLIQNVVIKTEEKPSLEEIKEVSLEMARKVWESLQQYKPPTSGPP